jgi:hypothetical protein
VALLKRLTPAVYLNGPVSCILHMDGPINHQIIHIYEFFKPGVRIAI